MRVSLQSVRTGRGGFEGLARLHASMEELAPQQIEIDMSSVDWFAANMCSPFEAILHGQRAKGIDVRITGIQPGTQKIMQKNGFLRPYGFPALPDTYDTSFKCVRFQGPESTASFMGYVESNFYQGGRGLPRMSRQLLREFRKSIGEIFDNAMDHSESELGIFACGQFYPRKQILDFSMTDRGIGIRANVEKHTGLRLAALKAIKWALEGENSTRPFRDRKSGGFGLKLIRDFVKMNRGRMIIVSDRGYWEVHRGKEKESELPVPFPGTAVTFEIDTSDTRSYLLSTEVGADDIW